MTNITQLMHSKYIEPLVRCGIIPALARLVDVRASTHSHVLVQSLWLIQNLITNSHHGRNAVALSPTLLLRILEFCTMSSPPNLLRICTRIFRMMANYEAGELFFASNHGVVVTTLRPLLSQTSLDQETLDNCIRCVLTVVSMKSFIASAEAIEATTPSPSPSLSPSPPPLRSQTTS
jgi:hypothetical protein